MPRYRVIFYNNQRGAKHIEDVKYNYGLGNFETLHSKAHIEEGLNSPSVLFLFYRCLKCKMF